MKHGNFPWNRIVKALKGFGIWIDLNQKDEFDEGRVIFYLQQIRSQFDAKIRQPLNEKTRLSGTWRDFCNCKQRTWSKCGSHGIDFWLVVIWSGYKLNKESNPHWFGGRDFQKEGKRKQQQEQQSDRSNKPLCSVFWTLSANVAPASVLKTADHRFPILLSRKTIAQRFKFTFPVLFQLSNNLFH